MTADMKPHWVSIVVPPEIMGAFEYHGPWWRSGYDADDNHILCAGVMATDEGAAYKTLRNAFDVGTNIDSVQERFCSEKELPVSDRFPRAAWMKWPWPVKPMEPRP